MNDTVEQKPKLGRRVRIILFVSLALNLLVVGLIAGAALKFRFGTAPHPVHFERPGGAMVAALTREERRAMGRDLRQAFREVRNQNGGSRMQYQPVIEALTTEPYDATAVRAAMDAQIAIVSARAERGRDMLLQRLEAMSPAERKAYAERLKDAAQRGPERFGGKPPGGHRH